MRGVLVLFFFFCPCLKRLHSVRASVGVSGGQATATGRALCFFVFIGSGGGGGGMAAGRHDDARRCRGPQSPPSGAAAAKAAAWGAAASGGKAGARRGTRRRVPGAAAGRPVARPVRRAPLPDGGGRRAPRTGARAPARPRLRRPRRRACVGGRRARGAAARRRPTRPERAPRAGRQPAAWETARSGAHTRVAASLEGGTRRRHAGGDHRPARGGGRGAAWHKVGAPIRKHGGGARGGTRR